MTINRITTHLLAVFAMLCALPSSAGNFDRVF